MTKIAIIIGSTRPQRFSPQAAEWINSIAQTKEGATFELIDLKDINLPLLDEPKSAMMDQYTQPHTKAWSEKISGYDGFVFIAQEYNHSYAPSLKNAIDYLYKEWAFKPVAFVSYGAEAGGARAVEHLRGVVAQVQMFDLGIQVVIANYYMQLDENGKFKPTDAQTQKASDLLDQIVFWTNKITPARQEWQAASAR